MGISISLTSLPNACHMGKKCVRKCHRQDAHAASRVAGEAYDLACHDGLCFPEDPPVPAE